MCSSSGLRFPHVDPDFLCVADKRVLSPGFVGNGGARRVRRALRCVTRRQDDVTSASSVTAVVCEQSPVLSLIEQRNAFRIGHVVRRVASVPTLTRRYETSVDAASRDRERQGTTPSAWVRLLAALSTLAGAAGDAQGVQHGDATLDAMTRPARNARRTRRPACISPEHSALSPSTRREGGSGMEESNPLSDFMRDGAAGRGSAAPAPASRRNLSDLFFNPNLGSCGGGVALLTGRVCCVLMDAAHTHAHTRTHTRTHTHTLPTVRLSSQYSPPSLGSTVIKLISAPPDFLSTSTNSSTCTWTQHVCQRFHSTPLYSACSLGHRSQSNERPATNNLPPNRPI